MKHLIFVKKSMFVSIVILAFFLLMIQKSTVSIAAAQNYNASSFAPHNNVISIKKLENRPLLFSFNNQKKEKDLQHEDIVRLTQRFMDQLVQKTGKNGMVINYKSKNELVQSFHSLSSLSLAKKYVDYYYKDYPEGLYLIPTELPPWFIGDAPYDKERINKNTIKIIQHNERELYGEYTIQITFTYDNGWKLQSTKHS